MRLRRAVRTLALGTIAVSPLVLVLLAVEPAPRVRDAGPPDALAAERTLAVAERLRVLADASGVVADFTADEDEINAVLAAAQRLVPGVVGVARVEAGALRVDVSAGAPLMPEGLWTNLRLELAPSAAGLEVASARVGRLPVPPALAMLGLRLGLDRVLGEGLGAEALASVAALEVAPPRVTVALAGDALGRARLVERLRAGAVGETGEEVRVAVYAQLNHFRKQARRGDLPRTGSVVPYLEAAVRFAGRSQAAGREDLRGALYALALACGDPAFAELIGFAPDPELIAAAGCGWTTLAGRNDLKRHFVVSAGLYAATTSGTVAFGVGELKELLDSNAGGEGFSFDDMAADAAGVRFAAAFLGAAPSAWPAMLAAIGGEADVMPSLDGLPEGMDAAAFAARFGDMASPQYASAVAEIGQRLDALPLYAPPVTN